MLFSHSAKDGPSPPKKLKEDANDEFKKKLKKQNDLMFKYHDLLKPLKKPELQLLLEFNNQEIPEGPTRVSYFNYTYNEFCKLSMNQFFR